MFHPELPSADDLIPLTAAERQWLEEIVPVDYLFRRLPDLVDFASFRTLLAGAYCPHQGRPAHEPLVMLKLEILARHFRLSDREVIAEAQLNMGYRLFLELSPKSPLPHPTSLTYFRQRLGPERLQQIFDALLGQARQLRLVKDRLRLKDATHIIANIAVPSTIRLVAQTRDRLLEALRPFASARADEAVAQAERIRQSTQDAQDAERLLERVTHLRAVLAWADTVPAQPGFAQHSAAAQEQLRQALALAHQVLADRDDPQTPDQVRSVHDPEARRGKHGGYFDGYLLDVSMDADSELLTGIQVLPGNGNEAADAVQLIAHEEQTHHNQVAALSLDGAGFRGPLLRELTDPDGLDLEVFVPPAKETPSAGFPPERFQLSGDAQRPTLTCPAGASTTARERSRHDHGWKYTFRHRDCAGCPLRAACLTNPQSRKGRTVTKNDYEAEYAAARARAATPEYAAVRRQHPAIERKLAELVRRHDLRHARYRGRCWVWYQSLLTGLVVNLKRLVRLWDARAEGTEEKVAAAAWSTA